MFSFTLAAVLSVATWLGRCHAEVLTCLLPQCELLRTHPHILVPRPLGGGGSFFSRTAMHLCNEPWVEPPESDWKCPACIMLLETLCGAATVDDSGNGDPSTYNDLRVTIEGMFRNRVDWEVFGSQAGLMVSSHHSALFPQRFATACPCWSFALVGACTCWSFA